MDIGIWHSRLWPFPKRHHAPPNAPRYRWATVGYVQGWFLVEDLERARRDHRPGMNLRFLPRLQPRPLGNGGW